ncbi:MAG: AAA family ATPase, partial [Sinomicrobium sp.]|nr:AAA family ATPase [Sinomicrobium sp.]
MKLERIIISNYKTLENIDISINTFYTAICGKNNAGKSSLLNTLKNILGYEVGPFDDISEMEISHKEDYTIWKSAKNE